jgi:predicted transcriptional regulator
MAVTTIKVPVELRDRLSEMARREHSTLATVIAKLLDATEEQAFWTEVRKAHAAMAEEERAGYVLDGTLGDDLADQADDTLTAEDAW